jgi:hypothetical protein
VHRLLAPIWLNWESFCIVFGKCPVRISVGTQNILTGYHGFPHFLQWNAGMVHSDYCVVPQICARVGGGGSEGGKSVWSEQPVTSPVMLNNGGLYCHLLRKYRKTKTYFCACHHRVTARYLKLGRDRFFPHPLQFIIHYHATANKRIKCCMYCLFRAGGIGLRVTDCLSPFALWI